ncbi:MAG: hypothetical protein A2X86_08830 [Bdellovibrionales bacterium GWA2_49_15]|nr:MAG: hypothetical protein A2X86_08830 [Bdellovibrionales bacterium GWA2_49_15]HAZ12881.1 hypothetical protein [Bdellovibrionales bacterium]
MKQKLFFFVVQVLWLLVTGAGAEDKFYGDVAREARLTFEGEIEIKGKSPSTLEELKTNSRVNRWVREKVDGQLQHIIGYFQAESFTKQYKSKASMDDLYRIKYTAVKKSSGKVVVSYQYRGKAVFDKKLFARSERIKIDIKLPRNPETIFALGVVNDENRCTDEHYNSEGDFFYFWDTELPGCPLRGGHPAVLVAQADAELLPVTDRTYPEYDKLYKGEKHAFIFIGYLDDEILPNRVSRRDAAYQIFKDLSAWVPTLNLSKVKELANVSGDILAGRGETSRGGNLYQRYQGVVKSSVGTQVEWNVHVLLSDTSSSSEDETFRTMYARALEMGSLIVYDGHSGLGGNLALDIMPEFDFEKMDYQIIYFNGCSSYPYFKTPYFKAKGGSKKLDIVTSGLTTFDTTAFGNMQAFLFPFLSGKTPSYQKIMKWIEESNGGEGTYLTSVNGDEDNEWFPSK